MNCQICNNRPGEFFHLAYPENSNSRAITICSACFLQIAGYGEGASHKCCRICGGELRLVVYGGNEYIWGDVVDNSMEHLECSRCGRLSKKMEVNVEIKKRKLVNLTTVDINNLEILKEILGMDEMNIIRLALHSLVKELDKGEEKYEQQNGSNSKGV